MSVLPAPSDVDDGPLALPPPPEEPPRAAVPWLAAATPVVGALGFWAVTGSAISLWFAAVGPLIVAAGVLDGMRSRRRDARRTAARADAACAAMRHRVADRHAAERARLRATHPDAGAYAVDRDQIWRAVPERSRTIVVGVGRVGSGVRVSGGRGEGADADLVRSARVVTDAPVVAALGGGVAVVGPAVYAAAAARAIVLQLAFAHPPGAVQIVPDGSEEWAWADRLPHRGVAAPLRVALGSPGRAPATGEIVVVRCERGVAPPPSCDVVLTLRDAVRAEAVCGIARDEVEYEAVGRDQAEQWATALARRAEEATPRRADGPPAAVALGDLPTGGGPGTLRALIGADAGGPVGVDLVVDGPHALVTGVTGSGKSELLRTWILALCRAYPPSAVAFLLIDFKGGTAFDTLAGLPHVTGVVTDLDASTAERAIASLRAEVRHREAHLAAAGARDISDVADLARLVIVVDEFATLRDAHPELEEVFVDLAARGRALGLHLVLGTQRAAGTVRDALRANCPLRISLRVGDAADSRLMVGDESAARLPGGSDSRGLAMVRRPADDAPTLIRVARADRTDLSAAALPYPDVAPPRRPWLPALPVHLRLSDLPPGGAGQIIGLLDEPERQRQRALRFHDGDRALLVVGGAGSGKSTALATIAAQLDPRALVRVGGDDERVWDVLEMLTASRLRPGATVLIDDLDALPSRFPDDYGRIVAERLERVVRDAGDGGVRVVASARRLSGPAARAADGFPRRLLLATSTRADHIAAGGDPASFRPDAPPGRGTVQGRAVQVAVADAQPWSETGAARRLARAGWPPEGGFGVVVRSTSSALAGAARHSGRRVLTVQEAEAEDADADGHVVVGTPDQWLARPRLLSRTRAEAGLVIDADCLADVRMITGERMLPPFARAGRGRAWEALPGRPLRRIVVADGDR